MPKKRKNEQLRLSLLLGGWPNPDIPRWFRRERPSPNDSYGPWFEVIPVTHYYGNEPGIWITHEYVQIYQYDVDYLSSYDPTNYKNYAQLLTLLTA